MREVVIAIFARAGSKKGNEEGRHCHFCKS